MEDNVDDERISQSTREEVLERDDYRCQTCGRLGAEKGGLHSLQVHHMIDIPSDRDRNDIENLITLCVPCHNWIHNLPDHDEIPIEVSDEAATQLLGQDYEIMEILHENGPLSIRDIKEKLQSDHSLQAIKDRLWLLMGLDVAVESQDIQLVDRDSDEGVWGIPAEISNSERGRIPDDVQTLGKRIEDEQVRQALERDIDRKTVAEFFGITSRATRYKERRAYAYDFPLDLIDSRGRPPETTDDLPDDGEDQSKESVDTRKGIAENGQPTDSEVIYPDENHAENEAQSAIDGSDSHRPSIEAESVDEESPFKTVDKIDLETDPESRYLLLSLDLDDDQRDAIRAYCASEQQSVHSFIESRIESLATELVNK